jgi:hypothetical protein
MACLRSPFGKEIRSGSCWAAPGGTALATVPPGEHGLMSSPGLSPWVVIGGFGAAALAALLYFLL